MFIKLGQIISMTEHCESVEIPPRILRNVIDGCYNYITHCQTTEGNQGKLP